MRHRRQERTCPTCRSPFRGLVRTSQRFCSRACIRHASLEERFWSKIDRSGGPDACWPWLGSRDPHGYGRITIDGRQHLATHVALDLDGRPIEAGQHACHRCDNPSCTNPAHLFAGSAGDNAADKVAKGRQSHARSTGEANAMAKLTTAEVVEIRVLRSTGTPTGEVAERFGIDPSNVRLIVAGKAWRHLLEVPA